MIRINLLASAQDRSAVPMASWLVWTTTVGGPAVVISALVLMGWWSWALRAEAVEIARAQADAEATLQRLSPAVGEVQDAEAVTTDLGSRVALIEALHARRDTAATMLEHLSRAVPDGLWFSEVREGPDGVVVRGRAATLATVSDYAAALEATGAFDAPVEIVDSQRATAAGGRQVVDFEVRISFAAAPGAGG